MPRNRFELSPYAQQRIGGTAAEAYMRRLKAEKAQQDSEREDGEEQESEFQKFHDANQQQGIPVYQQLLGTPGTDLGQGFDRPFGSPESFYGSLGDVEKLIRKSSQQILNTAFAPLPGMTVGGKKLNVSNRRQSGGGSFKAAGGVKGQVQQVAKNYGWASGKQWNALVKLVMKESSWNPKAANPTSSARGLFQKMTSLHGPVEGTVAGQAKWGLNYIKKRYGSPAAALAFHLKHNWY